MANSPGDLPHAIATRVIMPMEKTIVYTPTPTAIEFKLGDVVEYIGTNPKADDWTGKVTLVVPGI